MIDLGGLAVILAAVMLVAPLTTRDQTTPGAAMLDRMNPLLPTHTVYVSTTTDHIEQTRNAHGGLDYRYRLTSYDRCGCPRRLLITVTDHPLAPTAYLKVRAKGQTVLGWHAVRYRQLPARVQAHLR